jgi:hypothetical protein
MSGDLAHQRLLHCGGNTPLLASIKGVLDCRWADGCGVAPSADRHAVQDALKRAIGERGVYCDWGYDDLGWVVYLLAPEREAFRGARLQATAVYRHLGRALPGRSQAG